MVKRISTYGDSGRYLKRTKHVYRANTRPRRARQAIPRSLAVGRVHTFQRTVEQSFTLNQASGINGVAFDMELNWTLGGMNLYLGGASAGTAAMGSPTDFTNLFDVYRIDKVDLSFALTNNSSGVNTPTTVLPILKHAIDYNDSNAVTSAQINEYATCRTMQLGSQANASKKDGMYHVRMIPLPLVQTYRTAVSTGYSVASTPIWISVADTDVPHYGLKLVIDFEGVTGNYYIGNLTVFAKYYLSCKNTR